MPESSQKNNRSVLLKYAVNILNRRPYFFIQLKKKLEEKAKLLELEDFQSDLDSILSELQKSGYLNDEYLINGYINRCLSHGQGPKIITYKLIQLGLAKSQVSGALSTDAALEAISEAKSKLSAKFSTLEDFKFRHKLYQRGF